MARRTRAGRPPRDERDEWTPLGGLMPGNVARLILEPVGTAAFPTKKARCIALLKAGLATAPSVTARLGVINTGTAVRVVAELPNATADRVLEGDTGKHGWRTARLLELYLRGLAAELGIDTLNELLSDALTTMPDVVPVQEMMTLSPTGT